MSEDLHDCEHEDCHAMGMDDNQFLAHRVIHRVDDRAAATEKAIVGPLVKQIASLKGQIDTLPGSLGAHFHASFDSMEPTHAHLEDMLTNAEDCPGCAYAKAEYDASLRETFGAEQAEAAAARAAEAEAAKHATPPKPAPVVPRTFDIDDLDHFAVGAYGMETIEGDKYKYTIKVKPGADNAELAAEAIAEGRVIPANCVIRTGEDGTRYVCDPAA